MEDWLPQPRDRRGWPSRSGLTVSAEAGREAFDPHRLLFRVEQRIGRSRGVGGDGALPDGQLRAFLRLFLGGRSLILGFLVLAPALGRASSFMSEYSMEET